MALESKFFSDVALSTPLIATDFEQLEDGTNSSGLPSPADRVVYFGLPNAAKQVQALSNPGVDPILIRILTNVEPWLAQHTYANGDILQPSVPNGYKYQVEGNGDSGTTEPVFSTTLGSAFVDGGILLRCIDEIHEAGEIRLATSQAGLDSATPGADLNLGTAIAGNTAVPVWMRVTQGIHPAGAAVFYDLRFETVELTEAVI